MDRLVVPGPLALVALWLWLNPRVSPIDRPTAWASKGVYAERIWAAEPGRVPIPRRGPSG